MMKIKNQFLYLKLFIILIILCNCNITNCDGVSLETPSLLNQIKFSKLNNKLFKNYAVSDKESFDKHLDQLIVERIVNTKSHKSVQDYIVSQFDTDFWDIETDEFQHETILGKKQFTNIIVSSKLTVNTDLHSPLLILAAHYDSKMISGVKFLAAIDSAVSCAMMIDIAKSVQELLIEHSQRRLQLIFFDGEEAFKEWSSTDSLYGSRHLAHKLSTQELVVKENSKKFFETVDLFLLFDLIGAPDTSFYYFYEKTLKQFEHLSSIEDHLQSKRLISFKTAQKKFFKKQHIPSEVQDDHIPFLQYDIPILHLIPLPFPKVWHTAQDTKQNLDETNIHDLLKIFKVFVASYLNYIN